MSEVTTIGPDIAKNVFDARGADASGRALFSRKISLMKLLEFFTSFYVLHQICTNASGDGHPNKLRRP